MLIEKVVVYGEDAMEIVWKVRNPFEGEVSARKIVLILGK